MNVENNILSILTFASTRATWVSAASCAEKCSITPKSVRDYLQGRYWHEYGYDYFSQVASYYHYDFRIRSRGRTFYISAVSRGYL